MSRPTKRQVHNRKISRNYLNENKQQRVSQKLHALNFVFSIIACGLHYAKTAFFFLNDICPPAKSTFYYLQKKVVKALCQMAVESMNKAAKETRKNDIIAVDGAWKHCRDGYECQAAFMNQRTDKF